MKAICLALLSTALLLLPAPAPAQGDAPLMEDAVVAAQHAFGTLVAFVGDIHFDEKDVQSTLELWDEFQELGGEAAFDVDMDTASPADMEAVLKHPTYVAWIEKHGLDRQTWLRKVLRIQLLMAREEFDGQAVEGRAQMQEQLQEMETMREQIGEEMYQQMMKTMQAGVAMMDSMDAAMAKLPPPSKEEQKLLAKYEKELQRLQ